jgi:hypothetical protein
MEDASMKRIVIILFLMLPVAAIAQNQGMNGVDMGKMMQLMQEMQQCMAKVDQAELETLEQQSEKFGEEIEALCENGKRKKAQKKAIAYGKKVMKNPALVQMRKCGEITKGLMPDDSMSSFDDDFDFSNHHVCDE